MRSGVIQIQSQTRNNTNRIPIIAVKTVNILYRLVIGIVKRNRVGEEHQQILVRRVDRGAISRGNDAIHCGNLSSVTFLLDDYVEGFCQFLLGGGCGVL